MLAKQSENNSSTIQGYSDHLPLADTSQEPTSVHWELNSVSVSYITLYKLLSFLTNYFLFYTIHFFAFPLIFFLLIIINVIGFRQKYYLCSHLSMVPCETQLRETLTW